MQTLQKTKQWGSSEGGSKSFRTMTYDCSPRRTQGKQRNVLQLRQNRMEMYGENVSVLQCWHHQPGCSLITQSRKDVRPERLDEFGREKVYARAYAKFREAAWAEANTALGVEIGERKETFQLITDTLLRLAKAARQVSKKEYAKAARTLGLKKHPKDVSDRNTVLDNWMKYRYGFVPLMGSIHAWMESVDRPRVVFAKGTSELPFVWKGWNSRFWQTHSEVYGTIRVCLKGQVRVTSPRLVKLRDAGLVNPASIAFELISKSFVVGWFVDIGGWLDSYTDFVGVEFTDLACTTTVRGTEFLYNSYVWPQKHPGGCTLLKGPWVNFDSVYKCRDLLVTPPVPSIQLGAGISVFRAIDSIALIRSYLLRR